MSNRITASISNDQREEEKHNRKSRETCAFVLAVVTACKFVQLQMQVLIFPSCSAAVVTFVAASSASMPA